MVSKDFFKSATELAQGIRDGEISPVDLMRATLERIDELNPKLNAVVSMHPPEKLIADAQAVADRIVAGEDLGIFAGLPVGVKDLEDTVGLRTTHGSLLLEDAAPAESDAIQVERLKTAGAIVVGKTNTPEVGYTAFTTNRVFGPTHNPWNPERTPGGSSGGSSAAVASGMLPLATASDGGGSVRIPAAYTGLFGLKPSQGRIPWGPEGGLRGAASVVSGPLTRSVADAAAWLDATIGPHPLDPFSLPHPGYSYREVMLREPSALRIGYTMTMGYARCEKQIVREVESALRALEDRGHVVEEVEFHIEDIVFDWARLLGVEGYGIFEPHISDPELLDPANRFGFEIAQKLTPKEIGEIQRDRLELVRKLAALFDQYDLLATPTTTTVPFLAEGPIPTEIEGEPVATLGGGIAFTYPFNFSGNPAVSLRAGLSDGRLPVGLQLVAPRLREDLLLQVSRQYEEARPWKDAWPNP